MIWLGSFDQGSTILLPFSSRDSTGARIDFSGPMDGSDFRIYRNGSITERSSTAGISVLQPFDSSAGLSLLSIDLSDDSDSGFYSPDNRYLVVLYPDETLDSQSVSSALGMFKIAALPVAPAVNRTVLLSRTPLDNIRIRQNGPVILLKR